eukprot:835000_1
MSKLSKLNIPNPPYIYANTSISPITPDSISIQHNINTIHNHEDNDSKEVPLMVNLTACRHPSYHSYASSNQSPHHNHPIDVTDTKTETLLYENSITNIFKQKGYKIIRTLHKGLQGHIYHAIRTADNSNITIKQTSKYLHHSKTSQQDGMNIIVDENIIL